MKISFLMAAHNEEKIIAKALENLIHIPYDSYEVIIGLDGCTDNTEKIVKSYVKKSKKVKYFKLNLRRGKPDVINSIVKKAKGDIIIIHDADWFFYVKSRKNIDELVSLFDNKSIGGISESFPIDYHEDSPNRGNFFYKSVVYSAYYWFEFLKKKYTYRKGKIRVLKEHSLFMTNIMRKSLFEENSSLGDDFERTRDILKKGYDSVILEDPKLPRMKSTYDYISLSDLFNQKIRTAKAREQYEEKSQKIGIKFYLESIFYMLTRSFKNPYHFVLVSTWIVLTTLATFYSKFKSFGTKEGWNLRAKR